MKRINDQYVDLYPSGFDYLLTAISAGLTSYAAGRSVANTAVGWIFVVLCLLGVWISFAVMRAIRGHKFVNWNGFIYTGGVLAAFFSARALMEFLPDNPFKAQIFVCGLLLWMLAFGSFLIWSDQTLLFQAVPSIAIFGLVGCYDTYTPATWMFFGFLLCFATLLARVHGRTMLRQAKESGYSQTGERMDRSATELERMRSGPWRWVAGPQWALGSAAVVILFSFIGAPLIRGSVQGVAGAVRVQVPLPNRGASSNSIASNTDTTGLRIGGGSIELSDLPVFRASLDRPRYLRTTVFQNYLPTGWQAIGATPVPDTTNNVIARSSERLGIRLITKPETISFGIEPITSRLNVVPIPGEVTSIDPADATTIREDGTLAIQSPGNITYFKGTSVVSASTEDPVNAVQKLPDTMQALTAVTNIRPSVYDLANRVAATGKTDYERARLIKEEIERRAVYNLNVEPIPSSEDAVEAFLFDTKEGYCDLFASSMVLMARSVGIPARLVVGYYPVNGKRDEDGRYILVEAERHAWAELLFEGEGWMVFDPTENAASVEGGERGTATVSSSNAGTVRLIVDVGIGVAVLALLFFTGRSLFKGMKLGPSRTDLDKAYLSFAEVLARASGKPRNFDQTTSEYVRDALGHLNGEAEAALALNAKFERWFYSQQEPTKESIRELRQQIAALKARVKSGPPKVA